MTTLKTLILNLLLIASLIGFDRLLTVADGTPVTAQPVGEAHHGQALPACVAARCADATLLVIDTAPGPVYATLVDDATQLN